MKSKTNQHLIPNTFGIVAYARQWLDYGSEQELSKVVPSLQGEHLLHVGSGSNLLFLHDFDGVVLHCSIRGIELLSETAENVWVRVGASVLWDDFVVESLCRGWYGLENLSLVPGEVGASAVQNIGAYGVEAKDFIRRVETIDLQTGASRVFTVDECQYAYRQSIFKNQLRGRYAVTRVVFELSKHFTPHLDYGNIRQQLPADEPVTAALVRETVVNLRQSKLPDPKVQGNAGSFFMNPVVDCAVFERLRLSYPQMPFYEAEGGVKIPAGWLIEQCGWKGRALGCAGVHSRQALVLVNLGGATGEDILRLSDAVCAAVKEKFGITIHPEVNVIA